MSFLKWMFTLHTQVRDCNSGDKMKLTKYLAFKRIILLESSVTTSWSSNWGKTSFLAPAREQTSQL